MTDPLGGFRDELVASGRHAPRRSRRGLLIGAGAMALVAVVAAGVVWASSGDDARDPVVVADDPTTTSTSEAPTTDAPSPEEGTIVTSGTLPHGPVWSIAQPPGWYRTDPSGSIRIASPMQVLTGDCDQPIGGIDGGGAVVAISFPEIVTGESPPSFHWRREGAAAMPSYDLPCRGAPALVYAASTIIDGTPVEAVVAFGPDATPAVREQAWATVESLERSSGRDGTPTCVTTRVTEPGIVVPDEWPARPAGGVWWGTPDLWTELPTDGSYPLRKSVWWSQNFPGGGEEPEPDIWVRWRRLDGPGAWDNDGYGTNAHAVGYGWFMIAGGDPPGAGCWEVTAEYKGATLSYVYWLDPTIWAGSGGRDALVEGTVGYNPKHNCVVIGDRPVVWPDGTAITEDGAIELADGRRIELGDQVTGGGTYATPKELGYEFLIPEICVPDDGQIVSLGEISSITS